MNTLLHRNGHKLPITMPAPALTQINPTPTPPLKPTTPLTPPPTPPKPPPTLCLSLPIPIHVPQPPPHPPMFTPTKTPVAVLGSDAPILIQDEMELPSSPVDLNPEAEPFFPGVVPPTPRLNPYADCFVPHPVGHQSDGSGQRRLNPSATPFEPGMVVYIDSV